MKVSQLQGNIVLRKGEDSKVRVYYSQGGKESKITALNSFFKCFNSTPNHTEEFMKSRYNAGELVRELLRGVKDIEQPQHVKAIKESGILTEAIASDLLIHGKLTNGAAIGGLWDVIESLNLKTGIILSKTSASIPEDRIEKLIESEGIDGLSKWLLRKTEKPRHNEIIARCLLVEYINRTGMETSDVFNLPKLVETLGSLLVEVERERLVEMFRTLSRTEGLTVRDRMMQALGDKPEFAGIALENMFGKRSWRNANTLLSLMTEPSNISEPVQKKIADWMGSMVTELSFKPIERNGDMEWNSFNYMKDELSQLRFQTYILPSDKICKYSKSVLVETLGILERMQGYSEGYEKGRRDEGKERDAHKGHSH